MRRRRVGPAVLVALLLTFFGAFLLYPIWLVISGGLESDSGGLTLEHLVDVIADPVLREGLVNAFAIAACTTIASLLIAVPMAVASVRFDFPGRAALGTAAIVPLILPPFVGAIGVQHLLGRYGALNTLLVGLGLTDAGFDFIGRGGFWAIVLVEALHLYPITYLSVTAALANVDPALEEAASMAGAGRTRRFLQIVAPLMRPGIFAGSTVVFIWSLTELGTPLMFGYDRVTPVQIFNGLNAMAVSKEPFALAAVILASAVSAYVLGKLVLGRSVAVDARVSSPARARALRGAGGIAVAATFGLVAAIALLPHLAVVLTSLTETGQWYRSVLPRHLTLEHYGGAFTHPLSLGSVRNSLLYSSLAVLLDLGLGALVAWLIARTTYAVRHVLDALSMVPLAVPGLVLAFGYVAMTLRYPFRPGDPLHGAADVLGADPNPVALLVIAYAVRRMPYVVRSIVAGLEQTPRVLEAAARGLGAGRLRVAATITAPLIAANLIGGALLAFSFAMLEVSDSLILAQRDADFPLTKAIYVLFERLGDGPYIASAMGVWAMALLGLALAAASMLMGRRIGAMFRV